jgi:hypothetical protein
VNAVSRDVLASSPCRPFTQCIAPFGMVSLKALRSARGTAEPSGVNVVHVSKVGEPLVAV